MQPTHSLEGGDALDKRVLTELKPELEILRPLSDGTAARVYLARDGALGRTVAVKVLFRAADERTKVRFEREARAAASISHPCVVGVYRLGRLADGTPYLVMQYVRGRSLAERIAAEGRLPAQTVRRMLHDIASALAVAHARGILHRDVRPANILWDEQEDRFLLTDFGIAAMYESPLSDQQRLTRTGEMLGDVRYLSPQLLRGEGAAPHADVYALGVTAFEMLTSRVAHQGRSNVDLVSTRLAAGELEFGDDVDDRGLETLLRNCLSADPARRPSASALERLAVSGRVQESPAEGTSTSSGRIWRALRRRRLPEWVGSTAAAAWVLLEIVDQLIGNAVLPAVMYSVTLVTALVMIPTSAALAWFHGERGVQKAPAAEITLLGALFAAWLAAIAWLLL